MSKKIILKEDGVKVCEVSGRKFEELLEIIDEKFNLRGKK